MKKQDKIRKLQSILLDERKRSSLLEEEMLKARKQLDNSVSVLPEGKRLVSVNTLRLASQLVKDQNRTINKLRAQIEDFGNSEQLSCKTWSDQKIVGAISNMPEGWCLIHQYHLRDRKLWAIYFQGTRIAESDNLLDCLIKAGLIKEDEGKSK